MSVDAGTTGAAITERIIDALLEAEAALRVAGVTDTPRLEAEILLADALDIGRAELIASYGQGFSKRAEYASRIARRLEGEPVAYIVGKKEFMGFAFRVDGRALIPRPETETLVERAVSAADAGGVSTIAEIGVGCGCIAVSMALLLPEATIHATDVSKDALDLARSNAEFHGVSRRIFFHEGNVCSALPPSLRAKVDLIVSNPPYVTEAEHAELDRGIRKFEPPVALVGGADGLDVFREIAAGAADFLSPTGILAVEIGRNQGEAACAILKAVGAFAEIETIRDLAGRTRVVTCQKIK